MSASVRGALLTLSAATVLLFRTEAAHAQDADVLPTLDETPITAPEPVEAPPPPPVTVLKSPGQAAREARLGDLGPIRARRRFALLGEVGWNGIAGFGPNLVFHVDPHFSVDLGAGLSLLGWKVGIRPRVNFSTGRVTPFVGVGVMGAGGFSDKPITVNDDQDPNREPLNIKIRPSAWMQAVAGVDWIAPSGFNLVGAFGYAWLLTHDPVQIVTGTPTADEQRGFDVAFRSNVVITVALGYSFR